MNSDVNEFIKVVIDDLAEDKSVDPIDLMEIFERGFNGQNINFDVLNSTEKKAYGLGQMASQYDNTEEFRQDYLDDKLQDNDKLVESLEVTGENILQCEKAFEEVYSDELKSSGLSKEDIFEGFKSGYFNEETPEKEYLGMSDEDYEKYLLAYNLGFRANPEV